MARLQREANAWGLLLELPPESPEPLLPVWPENWRAVQLFAQAQSQWRTGPRGQVGLDYSVLPAWCRPGTPTRRGRRVLAGLQVMEAEALRAFRERKLEAET